MADPSGANVVNRQDRDDLRRRDETGRFGAGGDAPSRSTTPRSTTPLWAKVVLALLALSMIGGAVLGGF